MKRLLEWLQSWRSKPPEAQQSGGAGRSEVPERNPSGKKSQQSLPVGRLAITVLSVRFQLTDVQRQDACGENPSLVCGWVADRTNSVGWTRAADLILDRPGRVMLIIVVAFIFSRILRRLIDRFGRRLAHRSVNGLAQIERRAPLSVRRARRAGTQSGDGQPEDGQPEDGQFGDGQAGDEQSGGNGRVALRIDTIVAVISSLSTVVVWVVALVVALSQFNISLAPLFAGAGVVGVALGFGAQAVVSDFLSGFFMLFEDQFGVGDVVDLGEASGTVENLSLRTTTIRDVNGTVWHIRNSEIRRVGNKSQLWSRAVVDVEVAYDTDVRRAQGIMQRVADDLWRDPEFTRADIIDPPEVWGVEQLGADGVMIRLVVKTDPAEQFIIGRELRLRIKEAFDEAGIEIPFPQRTIWLRQDEPADRSEQPEVRVAPIRQSEPTEDMAENPG